MCKRLHDCDTLSTQEVRAFILEYGWSAYGVLQAVLDFCFKQKCGKLLHDIPMLATLIGVEQELLAETIAGALKYELLFYDGKHIWHSQTLHDYHQHSERKQAFKERASKAAKAKHQAERKALLVAEHKQVLREEEEEEEKEEEKTGGGAEGEAMHQADPQADTKQTRAPRRKQNFHPDDAHSLPLPESLDFPDVRATLTEWLSYRKRIGKKYKTEHWLIEIARDWEGNSEGLVEAIRNSMKQGWTGIFPTQIRPKNGHGGLSPRLAEAAARQARLAELDARDELLATGGTLDATAR